MTRAHQLPEQESQQVKKNLHQVLWPHKLSRLNRQQLTCLVGLNHKQEQIIWSTRVQLSFKIKYFKK